MPSGAMVALYAQRAQALSETARRGFRIVPDGQVVETGEEA
jgi:hypothetical protein